MGGGEGGKAMEGGGDDMKSCIFLECCTMIHLVLHFIWLQMIGSAGAPYYTRQLPLQWVALPVQCIVYWVIDLNQFGLD